MPHILSGCTWEVVAGPSAAREKMNVADLEFVGLDVAGEQMIVDDRFAVGGEDSEAALLGTDDTTRKRQRRRGRSGALGYGLGVWLLLCAIGGAHIFANCRHSQIEEESTNARDAADAHAVSEHTWLAAGPAGATRTQGGRRDDVSGQLAHAGRGRPPLFPDAQPLPLAPRSPRAEASHNATCGSDTFRLATARRHGYWPFVSSTRPAAVLSPRVAYRPWMSDACTPATEVGGEPQPWKGAWWTADDFWTGHGARRAHVKETFVNSFLPAYPRWLHSRRSSSFHNLCGLGRLSDSAATLQRWSDLLSAASRIALNGSTPGQENNSRLSTRAVAAASQLVELSECDVWKFP